MVLPPQNPQFGSVQTASDGLGVTSGAEDQAGFTPHIAYTRQRVN
jgi:hypothetical protein